VNAPARACTPVAQSITIYMRPQGLYHVHIGDCYADMLTWDEMLGEVAQLTHPEIRHPRYGETVDQHMERRARSAAKRREPELPLSAPEASIEQQLIDALQVQVNLHGIRDVHGNDALLPPERQDPEVADAMRLLAKLRGGQA
jgi:hypothetical protein